MKISTENDLFRSQLKMLYDMESQLVEAIPQLTEAATNEKLKDALSDHLQVTKLQQDRLNEIATALDIETDGQRDAVLEKMLDESQQMIDGTDDTELRDTVIMAGTDKVEHYEMAAYKGAIVLAARLNEDDANDMLEDSLDEEETAAKTIEVLASGEGIIDSIKHAIT